MRQTYIETTPIETSSVAEDAVPKSRPRIMAAREELERFVRKLRQMRDELRVRLHLGKQELRDEWENLESRWFELQAKLRYAKHASSATAEGILQITSRIAQEVEAGYERIMESLQPNRSDESRR